MLNDISLIYSVLDPEVTWTESAHAWVFPVNLVGMGGGVDFFHKAVPDDVTS